MITATKEQRRLAAIESASYPKHCVQVPMERWPAYMPDGLVEVWRSCDFLVQVFGWKDGACRLTVCRTEVRNKNWVAGISWDELQEIKNQVGYEESWAVEIFPPENDLVNVSNMRHLWILSQAPEFGWKKS